MLDPDSPYVAYCPPGALDDSRQTLDRGGHSYRELDEHPVLEGGEEIILVDTTAQIEVPPFDHFWWQASVLEHRMSAPLIPEPVQPTHVNGSTS